MFDNWQLVRALAIGFGFLFAGAAQTADKKAPKPVIWPTDVRIDKDVEFLPAGRKQKADLYHPLNTEPGRKLPGVIIIHGGGFNDGDKARQREINTGHTLALAGYVGMSINYKLSIKGYATWPQCLYDAKTAVRWMRANAGKLGVNPDRIGVIGYSAGGNLASMLALTGPSDGLDPAEPLGDISAAVKCAVDVYGAVDLPNYHDMKMFNKTRAESPELYIKGSPVHYVDPKDPPMLLIHGTADEVVPISQSQTLDAALNKAGVEHQFIVIPGAPHTFDLQPKQMDLRPAVLEFFARNLQGGK